MNREISPLGHSWNDAKKEIFTEEERSILEFRAALVSEIIKARRERHVSQKQLELITGIKQSVIARMETGQTNPTIDTVLKILFALGKTLDIKDI